MFRKTISLLLAVVLIFSVLPTGASAAVNDDEIYMSENNMNIEGTNAVGKIISDTLSAEAQQEFVNTDYRITDVTLQDNIATVSYEAKTDCTILVALYDDTSGRFLASGKTDAYATIDKTDVEIKGTMPEFFVTKVFMLDEKNAPLSDVFVSGLYTEEIQKVKNSTVEDYPKEKVVNLDTDNTTNFAVFSDKVKPISNDNGTNVIETIDEENGVYVFTNADEQLKNLVAGDIFSCQRDAENILVVKIKTITTDDDKVTIIQEKTDAKEVFDYIKIEAQQDAGDCEMDHSTLDKNITCNGVVNNSPKKRAIDESVSVGDQIEYGFDISSDENKSKSIAVGGIVTLGVKLTIDVYASLDEFYVDVALEYSLDFGVELIVNSEDVLEEDLSILIYSPIPGIKVTLTPKIILQAQVKIILFATISGKLGFNVSDDNGFTNTSEKPEADTRLSIQGDMFIGLALVPAAEIEIIDYDLAYTEISLSGGVEVTVESAEEDDDYNHSCLIGGAVGCFEGKINLKFEISGKAEVFENSYLQKSFDITAELGKFYYSLLWSDYGWGECPQKIKRTEPTTDETEPTTKVTEPTSTVTEPTEPITLTTPTTEPPVITQPTETVTATEQTESVTSTVSSTACGDNITWKLDDNGLLTLTGSGDMYDFNESDFLPPWWDNKDKITKLVINGDIKKIGNYSFKNCEKLSTIEFTDSITHIGEYAFCFCRRVKELNLPDNLEIISDGAFSHCKELSTVNFNNKLQRIEYGAFFGTDLYEFEIPDSVTYIGSYSFHDSFWYRNQDYGVLYIGKFAYSYKQNPDNLPRTVVIKDGIEYICPEAFRECYYVESLQLPDTLIGIEELAFKRTRFKSIVLPDSLKYIGESAFSESGISGELTIPANVENLYSDCFGSCRGLTDVYILGAPVVHKYAFRFSDVNVHYVKAKAMTLRKTSVNVNCEKNYEGLIPGIDYVLLVVKSTDTEDMLSADNILYIDQKKADSNGTISFDCKLREEYENPAYLIFNRTPCMAGDVNMDGKININDVTAIQRHLVGLTELSGKSIKLSDVDNNGTVDINDATTIQYYLVLLPRANSLVGKYSKVFI